MKKKVLVIVGPTASGKSEFAVRVAEEFNGEIISADSRQVYRGLDIGTGKITKREMRGIPHHLLDVADLDKHFTVADYKKLALPLVRYIALRGKVPIVVGGTGFYIDALRMSLPEVPPNPKLRKELEKKSVEELSNILGKHAVKDRRNKVRLIRAIEIVETLGYIPKIKTENEYDFVFIGIKPKDLDQKIKKRLAKRISGIIRETKKLSPKRAHELGLEYRFASLYLQKKLSKREFVEKLEIAIRRYAKRQMTWFKRNKDITWIDGDDLDGALVTTRRLLAPQRPRRRG